MLRWTARRIMLTKVCYCTALNSCFISYTKHKHIVSCHLGVVVNWHWSTAGQLTVLNVSADNGTSTHQIGVPFKLYFISLYS